MTFVVYCGQAAQGQTFVIRQGEHYSKPNITRVFSGQKLSFTARFNESARYTFTGDAASDQDAVNKLYGFSDCRRHHMKASARFGWFWQNGALNINAFVHVETGFITVPMGTMKLNKNYDFSIELSPSLDSYIFKFDGHEIEIERQCQQQRAIGYHLQPYFGGRQVAPHDIQIKVTAGNPKIYGENDYALK